MTNLASDASQMLAAAIEQMDDIIAGTAMQGMDFDNNVPMVTHANGSIVAHSNGPTVAHNNGPVVTHTQVNVSQPKENGSHADVPRLVDELRFAAERALENGEESLLRDRVEDSTKQYILRLLGDKKEVPNDSGLNDKIKKVESERESLRLQVSVLTDQLEAQNEKVDELEYALAKSTRKLNDTETKLLQESEIHCELEQSQQNYAMEASQLKARLDAVENETLVVRERAIMAETKIEEQQDEAAQLLKKHHQAQNLIAELQSESHMWQEKYMEAQALLDDVQSKQIRTLDEEMEKEKLKIAVDTLIVGNKEKDKSIDNLRMRLAQFYRVQELAAMHGKVDIDLLLDIDHTRTDSVSTSSSATADTDTSREGRPSLQGSSPQTPERDFPHPAMLDRSEDMFGESPGRRAASLENIKSALNSVRNDPSPDSNPSDPTPDTPIPTSDTTDSAIHNGTEQTITIQSQDPRSPTLKSSDEPHGVGEVQRPSDLTTSQDSPEESLPDDMIELATEMPLDEYSDLRKTPPFPVFPDQVQAHVQPEPVKRVNFDLDATTEISNDQRSSVGEDPKEKIDHVGVFLTQGAELNTNGHVGNGVHKKGSKETPADLTFTDIDDQDLPHFRRDVSQFSGHMTLPSPKKLTDLETELAARPNPSGYRTLPSPRKNQEFHLPHHMQTSSNRASPEPRKPRSSFGKGLFKLSSKKTSSAPNLDKDSKQSSSNSEDNEEAMTEEMDDALGVQRPRNVTFQSLERGGFPAPPGTPPLDHRRRKGGIKKLIGKLKRSGSASLNPEDEDEEVRPVEFSRNSRLRATAGPRLAWSKDLKKNGTLGGDVNGPFALWGGEQVADWLRDMGLAQYAAACRVWVKNGGTMLNASPLEIEKNLSLKNPLHRKKLQLALQALGSEQDDKQGELDYHWVTRWLDDVGLPQYKDAFLEAKVDGRMLHYLTVDDLLLMKVTSAFHHTSIMRGIQCLRLHNFHPSCLRRRPTDEPYETGTQVTLWTNHRVMEWLRSVDLSEYAPNLRGSGVHGGLMVLEPRFTPETLASILCIPGNKTLLRRHLSTHFISLIGPDIQHQKREAERQATYVPLNFLAKVKPKKRTFGKHRRGTEMEDYICPMDLGHPSTMNGMSHMNGNGNGNGNGSRPPPPNYKVEVRSAGKVHKQSDEGEDSSDVPEMQETAAPNFGALSHEINSLTTRLSDSEMDRSTHV